MEIDAHAPSSQFTILRIKRKRNEEPLDALVVESGARRKKSRGAGVFRFAKTVEDGVWQDEVSAKDVKEEVSRLARASSYTEESKPGNITPSIIRQKGDSRHYTVLNSDDKRHRPSHPPQVISSKDLPQKPSHSDIRMFDAILQAGKPTPAKVDPEMDKFLPLLQDYLKIHDLNVRSGQDRTRIIGDASDDYVWDVFYHRPLSLGEWSAAANIGTLSGLPPVTSDTYDSASDSEEEEDEADEDSNAEEYYKNDYPEEEELSDEFHESSDHEELIRYDEQGSDDDWL